MKIELRAWRVWCGWSQAELARLADVQPVTISELERGKAEVSAWTLQRLAQAFGVSRADLLHRAPAERWAEGWRPPEHDRLLVPAGRDS
jgi:transcriptional regulator with XRE-family HTH domain